MAVDRRAVADALAQANARTGLFRTGRLVAEERTMNVREPGYYWVRVNDAGVIGPPVIGEWDAAEAEPGWWIDGCWEVAEAVTVVSPRLAPPGPDDAPVPALTVRWNVPPGGAA